MPASGAQVTRPPRGLLRRLRRAVGRERCLAEPGRLMAYECDGLAHLKTPPMAVVLPESTGEVVRVVQACSRHGVPITPRGAGTCLSGGATPEPGGVLVETSRMRRILHLDPANRLAVVEPGLVNVHLSEAAAPYGLCYAPDPSSQAVCTLGGNVAENSGGPHCLKYGATTNHILAMQVVLTDGSVEELGSPLGVSSGLDLRGLLVGSEGTLGLVTRITCRLVPAPQDVETLLAAYPSLEDACRAVGDVIAAGVVPAALEALDERTIKAVEASVHKAGYPADAAAVLLVELDGHPSKVEAEVHTVRGILERHRALRVEAARDPAQRRRLWQGRKGAFGAMGRLAPDLYVQDAVVPRSRLPEVLAAVCRICDDLGLRLANVFHAGDGNLHPNIPFDGRDPEETARVQEAGQRIIRICLEAGGALSGEHGIGREKQAFMSSAFHASDLETMQRVRTALDPGGLMNPGKVLPAPSACVEVRGAGTSAGSRS